VDAEAALAPRSLLPSAHDAGAGAGDDHVSALGEAARELACLEIGRRALGGPRGSEDRHLPDVAIGTEHMERHAHFAERPVDELQVGDAGAVAEELLGGCSDLADELASD